MLEQYGNVQLKLMMSHMTFEIMLFDYQEIPRPGYEIKGR